MSTPQGDEEFTPSGPPPEKLEAASAAYGWLAHIAEMCQVGMQDLETFVPEEAKSGAMERARARAGAFHLGLDYGQGFHLPPPDGQ
jgi:hypothetical protein